MSHVDNYTGITLMETWNTKCMLKYDVHKSLDWLTASVVESTIWR